MALSVILLAGCDRGQRAQKVSGTLAESESRASTAATLVSASSPTEGYVSDQACQECHPDLFESYQDVGMAQSFYPPDADDLIEDFDNAHYYHPASDRHYEMYVEDGEMFQRRYQETSAGERINRIDVKVDAIIGSGNHIRSYVYRTPSGEMFQMPLAWYSQEEKWRMNPGYDNAHHQGFQRKITRECMFCHNAYPPDAQAGTDALGYPPVFPETLPHGIGCQRCHGPGQEHIALASDGASNAGRISQSIVNPSNLQPELRDDVCYQCHMQPSSEMVSELVRFDRGEYSYRPGEPLNEYRALLDYVDDSNAEGRFEINHHGYRLRQSPCHIEGEDSLSCISCHDPHRPVAPENRLQHYRNACLTCHEVEQCAPASEIESPVEELAAASLDAAESSADAKLQHRQLADCVQCHMPERRTQDVIHAVMTDHRIVKQAASEEDRLAAREEPEGLPSDIEVFPYRLPSDPLGERSQRGESWEIYTTVAGADVGNTKAISKLLESFRRHPEMALPAGRELAQVLQDHGDIRSEFAVRSQLAQAYPQRPQANLDLAMVLAAVGQYEGALTYYRRALDHGPPLPEAHLGIGVAMLQRNDVPQATKHFREAVRLRPYYPEALLNLGIALFAQRQIAEARKMLLRAKAADPTFVEADSYLESISQR